MRLRDCFQRVFVAFWGSEFFIAVFGSTEKSETSDRNPIFTNKTAEHKCKIAAWSSDLGFFTALPEAFV